jgi:hypothetical protein
MKAKVIETGETVEVNLYSSSYYKEKGQGYDRRGWYEDELEFEPGPKMVSLDKICEYLTPRLEADLGYYAAGDFINNLRKEFE